MASYSHGYYGLSGGGGSSKTADFGLAASMTLPMVTAVPDLEAEVAGHVTMPNEKRKRKKKARFSTDIEQLQETEEPKQGEVVLRNPSKKPSWRSRLSGIFRRNSTREEKREGGMFTHNKAPPTSCDPSSSVPVSSSMLATIS